ncbi:hypothetical protein N8511_04145 [Akkermansiaceae bacterium]|nr:hypothetical protein [Akkermansiaceae bacterium]
MARRTSNKIQPAVLTIPLIAQALPGQLTKKFIDLSQITSLMNRRFYRQGLNWAVAGFKVTAAHNTETPSGTVFVNKLPNTWISSNAWEKAFRSWNKQQMDAIEDAGAESAVARFRDFKIHADVAHVTAGFSNNWLPSGYLPGEWEPSQVVIPNILPDASGTNIDPQEVLLHMVGINNNGGISRGIIEGYADSRAFPQSPDPVSPDINSNNNWLRQMFDVGNDNQDITDNATNRNDNLPYPQTDYPGGETQAPNLEVHDFQLLSGTSIGGTTRLKGGNFPAGLIEVSYFNDTIEEATISLLIDLVPGHHRGYLCEPMTEM